MQIPLDLMKNNDLLDLSSKTKYNLIHLEGLRTYIHLTNVCMQHSCIIVYSYPFLLNLQLLPLKFLE